MIRFLTLGLLVASLSLSSQEHRCAAAKSKQLALRISQGQASAKPSALTSHEHKYDMKFVHLDLNVEDTTKYISGNSRMIARVSAAALDTYMVILHQNFTVDFLTALDDDGTLD